jgi:hypothetical protein
MDFYGFYGLKFPTQNKCPTTALGKKNDMDFGIRIASKSNTAASARRLRRPRCGCFYQRPLSLVLQLAPTNAPLSSALLSYQDPLSAVLQLKGLGSHACASRSQTFLNASSDDDCGLWS